MAPPPTIGQGMPDGSPGQVILNREAGLTAAAGGDTADLAPKLSVIPLGHMPRRGARRWRPRGPQSDYFLDTSLSRCLCMTCADSIK